MKPPSFPNVAVVGMHFRERDGVPAKSIVANFVPPVDLEIEREPENPFDSFAIKVLYQGDHIGYIEVSQACYISPWIDQGIDYLCVCQDLEMRKQNLHPIVLLTPAEQLELKKESHDEVPA